MSEFQQHDDNRESEAPSAPPLRAAFLVWPGKVHSQTWQIFWVGILYLLGALLPWTGVNGTRYLLTSENAPRWVAAVQYNNELGVHNLNSNYPHPGQVIAVSEPGMGFGQVLLLLCAIAMVVTGAISIWNRRLALTPTLCTWFVALATLYFYKGWPTPTALMQDLKGTSNGFSQFGNAVGAIFGEFGSFLQGSITPSMQRVFDGAGLGFYVTMVAQIALTLIVVLSLVMGGKSKGQQVPAQRKRR